MTLLALIGIACSFFMVKYREKVGDMIGDPEWAAKVGGIYNVIVILAIILFFWSVAALTGTGDVLLKPLVDTVPKPGM